MFFKCLWTLGSSICQTGKWWVLCGQSLFLCLPEHFQSHIGIISLIARYFHVTCILSPVCLSPVCFTIRTVSGDYILRDWEGGPWIPKLLGDLNWRGGLIWKGKPQSHLHSLLYFAHLRRVQRPFIISELDEIWVEPGTK